MPTEHFKFGGGAATTALNPIVFFLILIVGGIVLFRPYRSVIIPFFAVSILVPMDQVLLVGSLHFPMLRLLALFGIVRLIREKSSSKKIFSGGMTKIDYVLISFVLSSAVAGIALFREWGEVVFQLGEIYTAFGLYFLFRFLIRDKDDFLRMVRTFAYIAPFIASIMIWEVQTGTNPYAMLGGARASFYANLLARDNRFRAVGCFGGPITAGTFGAMVAPLFVLLWREKKKYRPIAAIGLVATLIIILTSNSSTPILAYGGGLLAVYLWPLRNRMRMIRWAIVASLLLVHIVWKHPVWYLIAKVDVSGGSSSWHRFALIDQCIRHFGDWWLVGVKSTAEWGWDMWDTANQYVGVCDASGLLPFILFISILVYGFKYLGRARRRADTKKMQLFYWALGGSLFANVVSFFGISYWDQTQVVWYGLLAAISALAVNLKAPVPATMSVSTEKSVWPMQLAEPAFPLK
ncbi:MAG TPA: hypothetical protein VHQ22_22155 [Terriglobales bacterium]|nr:hypothetical protein [Terriglobales bacterium]